MYRNIDTISPEDIMDELSSYRSDLSYLRGLSDKGSLNSDNSILRSLRQKTNLPQLQKALDQFRVNYI
ncbi:hypothetical protein [Corynebacterium variabile]|uniref:hypothetical protein n=1 Tax=Corynebacterium variabile TaxID=1727 RepID=UPI003A90C802